MSVLLMRPRRNEDDRAALEDRGLQTIVEPWLEVSAVANEAGAMRLIDLLGAAGTKWLVVTSLNAVDFWQGQLPAGLLEETIADNPSIRFAAIGESTARRARELGATEVLLAEEGTSRYVADAIAAEEPAPVILPSGSISMRSIPDALVPKGFVMHEEVFYTTTVVDTPPASALQVHHGGLDAVVVRSPSAARALHQHCPKPHASVALIATGPTTAREMERLGLPVWATSPASSARAVADTVVHALASPPRQDTIQDTSEGTGQ